MLSRDHQQGEHEAEDEVADEAAEEEAEVSGTAVPEDEAGTNSQNDRS